MSGTASLVPHAFNVCTRLPGPEAQQLATYLGWLMHKARGGLAAGLLFVLPGAAVMPGLSLLYATVGDVRVLSVTAVAGVALHLVGVI